MTTALYVKYFKLHFLLDVNLISKKSFEIIIS